MSSSRPTTFGWRYNKVRNRAVIRKKSQVDFVLSIIIAFLIIFIISQCLAHLDSIIRSPYNNALSAINPLQVNTAFAANDEAIKIIQSHREINIMKGKGFTFTVGFKNEGNKTWQQKGNGKVELKLAPPYTRDTIVRHKFWRDQSTPAWLDGSINKPGWVAYYRFALEAPVTNGVYTESFVLVRNDNEIISGSEFDVVINVWDSATAFENKEIVVNKPEVKPTTPQPQPKPQAKPQDDKYNDAHYELVQKCLTLKGKTLKIAVNVSETEIDDCSDLGIDLSDRLWEDPYQPAEPEPEPQPLPDPDPQVQPQPNVTPSTNDGPDIRIGLFYTTEPIIIKANTSFSLKDKNGVILTTVSANQTTTYNFNLSSQIYSYTTGVTGSTGSYLRLESNNPNTVYEVVSYESRPAWNTSLNDNKYLGDLEIRYSPNTGRLWLINELPLETYLKGLAESSNSSPLEYQKALITAARTYATHHLNRATKHANEYFILDARYDQVYKGYGAQSRLPIVTQAVEATKGVIVTYDGEIAITPYFSHSDGRTRDWSEVWGGDIPWCKGVPEPAGYTKTTLFGHGVGMSAYGAILLANDYGYNYEQILKYYYTGIELKDNYQ
ncbi:SpoIID/LytB domain-containing protein [Patescibacteria group bacterium]